MKADSELAIAFTRSTGITLVCQNMGHTMQDLSHKATAFLLILVGPNEILL